MSIRDGEKGGHMLLEGAPCVGVETFKEIVLVGPVLEVQVLDELIDGVADTNVEGGLLDPDGVAVLARVRVDVVEGAVADHEPALPRRIWGHGGLLIDPPDDVLAAVPVVEVDVDDADPVDPIGEVAVHAPDEHVVHPAETHGLRVGTVVARRTNVDKCLLVRPTLTTTQGWLDFILGLVDLKDRINGFVTGTNRTQDGGLAA
jgi:hypothetical protein